MASSSNIIRLFIMFIVCVISQLLIFNNLQISGFINPYIYILLIMSMPFGTSTATLMVISFITGITIDIFCNTPGMHASACVLIGYIRQYVLKFIAFRDEYKTGTLPSINAYGIAWYVKYTIIMVAVHHVMLFFVEQFDTLFFWPTLLRVILSIVATSIFILIAQFFVPTEGTHSVD